jgi:hypothetical protein
MAVVLMAAVLMVAAVGVGRRCALAKLFQVKILRRNQ